MRRHRAPEATYQAWLAHFAIGRLTPLHVVREVDFGARYLGPGAGVHFRPLGNLMVDMLILRQPIVHLPRRSALAARDLPDGAPNPRSGLARLLSRGRRPGQSGAGGLRRGLRERREAPVQLRPVASSTRRCRLRPDVLLAAFDVATGDVSFESVAG
ncbi:hypothetical protein GCM10023258_30310 [Terrabacter aeriphilus]|uniref:Uncharacterized protein n=1 Tax=Terrabacter aeriphilus TaxID=515662 RepID=A0ABP9JGZ7_9MICO